jgi:hypothetical protein
MKRELRGKKFRSDQQSAARFREVGGALQEVHRLPREVLRKRDRHHTSTNFRLGVIRWVHELFKRPRIFANWFLKLLGTGVGGVDTQKRSHTGIIKLWVCLFFFLQQRKIFVRVYTVWRLTLSKSPYRSCYFHQSQLLSPFSVSYLSLIGCDIMFMCVSNPLMTSEPF